MIFESSVNKNIDLINLKSFVFFESLRILDYTEQLWSYKIISSIIPGNLNMNFL